MREFGSAIGLVKRNEIIALAQSIFKRAPEKRAVRGEDFAMDEVADQVVLHEVDLRWDEERLRIAVTEADARPPFEWLMEITSDVGEADYFKHYLVRENDIVLAQRKVLTPIDSAEADLLLADLREAEANIA